MSEPLVQVWSAHYSFMRFRSSSSHAQCTECIRHKAMISGLGHHLKARRIQQQLLYNHLSSQFRDRVSYWHCRGQSRSRGLEICLIQDGMDQSKFQAPRGPFLRAKAFESFNKPRLHVCGVICHGYHLAFYVSEPTLPKDSNTSCEILAHTLQLLAEEGVNLSACRVTLQADNTCREVKNGILMRYVASLVSDNVIGSGRLSFLRTGHSHEDIDQVFGRLSTWVRNNIRSAATSADFVDGIREFCNKVERPHEPNRYTIKLDRVRDWCPGGDSCLALPGL